jgi:hypothetical protein
LFVHAIEIVGAFTRPIHSIERFYGSTEALPGAATLFFVNAEGWALTCRHVAEQILAGDQLAAKFTSFKAERDVITGKSRQQLRTALERKYGFSKDTVVELRNRLIDCFDGPLNLRLELHPELDVALIKFSDFTSLGPTSFPVFATNGSELKQGIYLCRLGYPFPEFDNFEYDAARDTVDWTDRGRQGTPRFPIEGMVTRHLLGSSGEVMGFELSTPGLRGQSGGPAFDRQGRIWGMQTGTAHLDLNFDVDMEVVRAGSRRHVRESALLHVGHCVHVEVLKAFLRQHSVAFDEG